MRTDAISRLLFLARVKTCRDIKAWSSTAFHLNTFLFSILFFPELINTGRTWKEHRRQRVGADMSLSSVAQAGCFTINNALPSHVFIYFFSFIAFLHKYRTTKARARQGRENKSGKSKRARKDSASKDSGVRSKRSNKVNTLPEKKGTERRREGERENIKWEEKAKPVEAFTSANALYDFGRPVYLHSKSEFVPHRPPGGKKSVEPDRLLYRSAPVGESEAAGGRAKRRRPKDISALCILHGRKQARKERPLGALASHVGCTWTP